MTADPWLCAAGTRLRTQIGRRWPDRDTASDGWIGDDAHADRPSDHNPAPGSGVVRAIDIDADLHGGPHAMQRLCNQLVACAADGKDRNRLSYVIYNGRIASGTYNTTYWKWRAYDGDPHTHHAHVSFTTSGDLDGHRFPLPVFTEPGRLSRLITRLTRRIDRLRLRRRRARRRLGQIVD